MMERDYGQEKRDIASKIAEKKNQEIIDKKLDRINFLLERNKKINDEKNSIIGSLSVKIADQGEEFYTRVETARGELGVYIVSEGGTTPYRIKFRSPGFSNLSALDHMARGSKLGDLVAMMGTLDLVIPDIDR